MKESKVCLILTIFDDAVALVMVILTWLKDTEGYLNLTPTRRHFLNSLSIHQKDSDTTSSDSLLEPNDEDILS